MNFVYGVLVGLFLCYCFLMYCILYVEYQLTKEYPWTRAWRIVKEYLNKRGWL